MRGAPSVSTRAQREMGGQACIAYGAAEFSRDTDFAILCSPENLDRLREALADLEAEVVFLPPLEIRHLERGHACHFRCRHPDALGLRIDVLSVMRGCDPFPILWERRETIDLAGLPGLTVLSLPDLVRSKKTQRDWPMVRRLIEADCERRGADPRRGDLEFWLRKGRTPSLLVRLARGHPELAAAASRERPLLELAAAGREGELERALIEEEGRERAADRAHGEPLRRELEAMRRRPPADSHSQ